MRRFASIPLLVLALVMVAGCQSLPGLRVLTGEGDPQSIAETAVQAGDLVMADKSGGSDPGLSAAADRIEAASGAVDIIEIREDFESRLFQVSMLFNPPQTDNSTQGQIAQLDALRRAFELTWVGTMRESSNSDTLLVTLLAPQSVTTLDNGTSFIGIVIANAQIERSAAQAYLDGERSLNTFFDMIADGTLLYESASSVQLYEGSPNHPMFMISAAGSL